MVINISTYLIFRNQPVAGVTNNEPDDKAVASRNRAEEGVYFRPENYQILSDLIRDMKEEEKRNYLAQAPKKVCIDENNPGVTALPEGERKKLTPCGGASASAPIVRKILGLKPGFVKKSDQPLEVTMALYGDYLPDNGRFEITDQNGNPTSKIKIVSYEREKNWPWNEAKVKIKVEAKAAAGEYNIQIFDDSDRALLRDRAEKVFTVIEKDQPRPKLKTLVAPGLVAANDQPQEIVIVGEDMSGASVKVMSIAGQLLYGPFNGSLSPDKKNLTIDLSLDPDKLAGLAEIKETSRKKYLVSLLIEYSDKSRLAETLQFYITDERHPVIVAPEKLEVDKTSHNAVIFGPGFDKVDAIKIILSNGAEIFSTAVNESNSRPAADDRVMTIPVSIDPQDKKLQGLGQSDSRRPGRTNFAASIVLLAGEAEIIRRPIILYSDSIVQPFGLLISPEKMEADNTEHKITIIGPALNKIAKIKIIGPDGEMIDLIQIRPGMLSDQDQVLTVPVKIDPQALKTSKGVIELERIGRTSYAGKLAFLDKSDEEVFPRQKFTLYDDSVAKTIPPTFDPGVEKVLGPQGDVGVVFNSEAGRVPFDLGFVPQVIGATDRAMVKIDWLELNLEGRGSLFLGEEYKEVANGARLSGNVIIRPFKWLGIEAQGNYTWSGQGSTMNLPYFYNVKSQTGKFTGAVHFDVSKVFMFKFNANYTGTGYNDANGIKTADDRWRVTAALLLDMTKVDSAWVPSRFSVNGGYVFSGTRTADGREDNLSGGGFMSRLRWDRGIFKECPMEPYFGIEWEKSVSANNKNAHFGVKFNIMDFLRNTLGERHSNILPPQSDY
ncbi:MAG: hypothetical protein PHG97_05710 [Candidatus Margulisbacteria bacterium]|nr:hypothetical protein [Candidatus Margulisiibacteriota bacterium]